MEELAAIRQTLQTDLETSIRRIADLQAALEEVASSDSDTERCLRGAGGAGHGGGLCPGGSAVFSGQGSPLQSGGPGIQAHCGWEDNWLAQASRGGMLPAGGTVLAVVLGW